MKYVDNVQLYHFNTCPFCLKVKLAIKLMGIKIKSKNILADPDIKAELIAGGGKQQVPCLRIEEDNKVRWLYESSDIIKYLRKRYQ